MVVVVVVVLGFGFGGHADFEHSLLSQQPVSCKEEKKKERAISVTIETRERVG